MIKKMICITMAAVLLASCAGQKPAEETPEIKTETQSPAVSPPPEAAPASDDAGGQAVYADIKQPAYPFSPIQFSAEVQEYELMPDLSNIENLAQFGELTDNQKELLLKNHFFVTPSDETQLFFVYEQNEYKEIPSFVTTDSMLQLFHMYFSYLLRNVENDSLVALCEQLTDNMLDACLSQYETITEESAKTAMEHCIAYFAVAQELLKRPVPDIPENAKKMFDAEIALIKEQNNFDNSPVANNRVLYENFVVRGHYTRNEDLSRYFQAMTWYGTLPFAMKSERGDEIVKNNALVSMLMTNALMTLEKRDGTDVWEAIYSPSSFFVGNADDLTPFDIWNAMNSVYGAPDINALNDGDKIERYIEECKKLYKAKIINDITGVDAEIQFRFMGQRYIPDSEIMQRLSKPVDRPFPSGLDVAAVLGSDAAEKHVAEYLQPTLTWPGYTEEYNKLKTEFGAIPDDAWRSNLYFGWLWTLKPFFEKIGEGFPMFMRNEAWEDKSLSTALGSWAELRHDTVLYAKSSGAEKGGGLEEMPKSYVEPNIAVYERLKWLTGFADAELKLHGLISEALSERTDDIVENLDFLIHCSKKELNNEPLTEEELSRLLHFGAWLEAVSAMIASDGEVYHWYEIVSEVDRNMAVVADVHNAGNTMDMSAGYYLEEAVGTASQIFVVTPSGGKLYLTRGAVFDYYEFESEDKLTDEKWQEMLSKKEAPERPVWTKSFIDTTGIGYELPNPEYNR